MKTAVSVPGDVFGRADRLARRLKKSRSSLYSEALTEYLARHDPDQITEKLNALSAVTSEPAHRFVVSAARRILEHNDW